MPLREPNGLGFGLLVGATTWNGHETIRVWHAGVAVPWWYLALLACATPAQMLAKALWRQRRSERRRRSGRCLACGYDLRATPERCPECGSDGMTQT